METGYDSIHHDEEDEEEDKDIENTGDEDVVVLSRSARSLRLIKTVCMITIWISMGYSVSLVNATIIDLKTQVNSDYEEITRALAAKSVGAMVGSVIAGLLGDRFLRQVELLLACELLLLAAGVAGTAWMPNLAMLGLDFAATGLAHGALSANGNVMCLRLWGDHASAPLQAVHMGFGIGTLLAPVIAVPFLSPNQTSHNNSILTYERQYTMTSLESISGHLDPKVTNSSHEIVYRTYHHLGMNKSYPFNDFDQRTGSLEWIVTNNSTASRIYIPYAIGGGLTFLTAILFLLFYMCTHLPYVRRSGEGAQKSFLQLFNPASCTGGQTGYGVFILVSIFLIYVGLVGKDTSFGTFTLPLAVETHLNFTKTTASYIVTAYFGGYTFGRLLASILSTCMSVTILVFIEVICNLAVIVWMVVANLGSKAEFWVMTVLFGIFSGPIYPGCLAWLDKNMTEVSSLAIAVVDLGVAAASLAFPWLSGYLYQYVGKMEVIYLSGGCCIFLLAMLIVAQIVASIHNRRVTALKSDSGEPDNTEDSNAEHCDDVSERTPLINS